MIECDFCDYKQGDYEVNRNEEFRLFFVVDGMDCCEVCKREMEKEK